MEISHVFRYKDYTVKQRIIQWLLYMLRNFMDIFSGIVGILTLGIIQTWWSCNVSERILRNQMEFYREKKK